MTQITPVGIDLGTTLSAAAYVGPDGKTCMIPNAEGDLLTPSVVLFGDDERLVGRSAWEAAATQHDRVAQHVKRDMGQSEFHRELRGNRYPPEVIQACILRQMRADVAAVVGASFQAVITAPAYFDQAQRKTTADAGAMSGLEILDIVNEPTAAALAYGEKLGYLSAEGAPSKDIRLLVYDLGGGTFDVTIIELSPGRVRTLSTDGDVQLGGWDWDMRLALHAELCLRDAQPDMGELGEADRIAVAHAAQQAKHELSVNANAQMEFMIGGQAIRLPITRDVFENMTADLVERTCFTTRQALKAAGMTWDKIDRLVLVGGSTRMPAVRAAVRKLSGKVPDKNVSPDQAVARGAAIFAQHCLTSRSLASTATKLHITDVISHSLGIEGLNLETTQTENVTLIPRNTPVPFSVTRRFVTKEAGQRTVKVQLLEGESRLPSQCSQLAVAAIRNLPPGLPKGTSIEVTYSFDAAGRVSVHAQVPGQGAKAEISMERIVGLTGEGVDAWKQVVCRDGGYRDMEDAISSFLSDEPDFKELPDDFLDNKPASARKPTLDPSVPHGAPQAASERLKESRAGKQKP